MNKNKHTDLDGLIDLDSRSLIKLGNSAVVSIPSADDSPPDSPIGVGLRARLSLAVSWVSAKNNSGLG